MARTPAEEFPRYAAAAEERADKARDYEARQRWRDAAAQWRELADRVERMLRDQAFEPEALNNIRDAFAEARKALGLTYRDDKLTDLVARQIIALAQQDMKTKTALQLLTVRKFIAEPQRERVL